MSLLRSSFVLRSALQRAYVARSYATAKASESQDSDLQKLLNASRAGNLEVVESLAKGMKPNRQIYAAVAAAHLANFDWEKAEEYTKMAENSKE